MLFTGKNLDGRTALWRQASRELAQADPTLGAIIQEVGPCQLVTARRNNYFAALVEAIVFQQLAGAAAQTILARFRGLYPARRFPSAEQVWQTPESRLRSAGLSSQKISYLKDLSRRVVEGSFPPRGFAAMDDEEVVRHLTAIKGIGRWTAEMFLIFCLGRPDVLPLNDLGILKAAQKAYGFRSLPSARTLERMGQQWRPYRSVAAWYLWASVDGKKPPEDA